MSITRNEFISPTCLLYGLHYIILHSQRCSSFLLHAVGFLACLSIIQINDLFSLIYLGTRWSEQNSGNTIATNDDTHNSTFWLGLDGQYKQPFWHISQSLSIDCEVMSDILSLIFLLQIQSPLWCSLLCDASGWSFTDYCYFALY